MEMSEVKKMKQEAEERVLAIIKDLEDTAGLSVNGIDILHGQSISRRGTVVLNVRIRSEI